MKIDKRIMFIFAVKRCPSLKSLRNGYRYYEHGADYMVVGTICHYVCHEGFKLEGASKRKCKETAQALSWTPRSAPICTSEETFFFSLLFMHNLISQKTPENFRSWSDQINIQMQSSLVTETFENNKSLAFKIKARYAKFTNKCTRPYGLAPLLSICRMTDTFVLFSLVCILPVGFTPFKLNDQDRR